MRGTNIFTTGITRTTNSLSLTVNNIRIEDGGSYVCSAEDSFGERATLTTVVMVDGKFIDCVIQLDIDKILNCKEISFLWMPIGQCDVY